MNILSWSHPLVKFFSQITKPVLDVQNTTLMLEYDFLRYVEAIMGWVASLDFPLLST